MACTRWSCLDMGSLCCKDCIIRRKCRFKCDGIKSPVCSYEVKELVVDGADDRGVWDSRNGKEDPAESGQLFVEVL